MTTLNSFLRQNSKDIFEKAALGTQKSVQDNDFLTHIPDPLQGHVQDMIHQVESSMLESSVPVSECIIDQFEISTRTHSLSLANAILQSSNDAAIVQETVEDLLYFIRNVIDVVLHFMYFYEKNIDNSDTNDDNVNNNTNNVNNVNNINDAEKKKNNIYTKIFEFEMFRKIPFQLLEDIADTLPIQTIQLFWNYGPSTWLNELLCKQSNTSTSTSTNTSTSAAKAKINANAATTAPAKKKEKAILFNNHSKFCVLRLCNRILKNLSVSSSNKHAQFAGQITMTLASVYPLSERSAVNCLGKFNIENVVDYESLDDWYKSNNNNTNNSTNSNSTKKNNGMNKSGGSETVLSYDFYQTFWVLQKKFTDPSSLLPKSGGHRWNDNMNEFVKNAETVMGAFESNKFPGRLIKDLKNRWNKSKKRTMIEHIAQDEDTMDVDMDTDINMDTDKEKENDTTEIKKKSKSERHYKYMTNSQLLHLQLQDPEIRMQILTQLFIISAYLSQEITTSPSIDKSTADLYCDNLAKMEHRAGELLKLTPPNGEIQYTTLQWILKERESIWRNWKKNKCEPKIEKFHNVVKNNDENKSSTGLNIKRRRLADISLGNGANKEKKGALASLASLYSYKIDVKSELPSISKAIASKHTPDKFTYLEEYVDALDPEAEIEDEYHPKNNKLFAWRAMRLLNKQYIGRLGPDDMGCQMIDMANGNFEGLVRKVWKEEKGVEIPGQMPMAGEDKDEVEEDEGEVEEDKEEKVETGEETAKKESNEANTGKGEKDEQESLTSTSGANGDQEIMDVKMETKETVVINKDLTKELPTEAGEVKDESKTSEPKLQSTATKSDTQTSTVSSSENLQEKSTPSESVGQKRKRDDDVSNTTPEKSPKEEKVEGASKKEPTKLNDPKQKAVSSNQPVKAQNNKNTKFVDKKTQPKANINNQSENRPARSNHQRNAPQTRRGEERNDRRDFPQNKGRGAHMSRNPPTDNHNTRGHPPQQQAPQDGRKMNGRDNRRFGHQDNTQHTGSRFQQGGRGDDRRRRGNHGGSGGGQGRSRGGGRR